MALATSAEGQTLWVCPTIVAECWEMLPLQLSPGIFSKLCGVSWRDAPCASSCADCDHIKSR